MNTRNLFLALIAFAAPLEARIWRTSDGGTLDAEFVRATATHVTVRTREGVEVPILRELLTEKENAFVTGQMERGAIRYKGFPGLPKEEIDLPASLKPEFQPPWERPPFTPPPALSHTSLVADTGLWNNTPRFEQAAPAPATPPPGAKAPPAPQKPIGSGTQPAAKKSPYADYLANDWKQFEGKGGLQCMLFGAPVTDPTKKVPLVIYLHGKNNNVLTKKDLGFAGAVAKPENFSARPCIILAPQCPDTNGWSGATGANFMKTLKDMMRHLPIDEDRVYLTGYSMGGYGTFAFLNEEPRMFAAGMPIAGSANVGIARNLKKIPMWIFHGEKDDVVKPEGSRDIAKALEKMKAPVKYTEFPGEGHGIGGKIFGDPNVHTWLFEQKRK